MFSGIVERMGTVRELISDPPGVRLVIESPEIAQTTKIGDSIAVNGCCLTVVAGGRVELRVRRRCRDAQPDQLGTPDSRQWREPGTLAEDRR